jgi:hypothetical protein
MVQWTISSNERRASLASLEEGQVFLVRDAHRKAKPAWASGGGYLRLLQKLWMRRQASSSALFEVA